MLHFAAGCTGDVDMCVDGLWLWLCLHSSSSLAVVTTRNSQFEV
jgi:hypothetical protein